MDEPIAVARDGPLDAGDVGGVEADAQNRHRTPVCLKFPCPTLSSGSGIPGARPSGAARWRRWPTTASPPARRCSGRGRSRRATGGIAWRWPWASRPHAIVRLRQVHGDARRARRAARAVSSGGVRLERRRHRGQRPSRGGRLREGGRLRADPAGRRAERELWPPSTPAGAARPPARRGWRSRRSASTSGPTPADLVAAIGPSIGPCCYRVGQDVRAAFEAAGTRTGSLDAWFSRTPAAAALHGVPGTDPAASGGGPALFLDTWTANADQLRAAGVPRVADPRLARLHVLPPRDLPLVSGGWREGGEDDWGDQRRSQ